MIKRGGIIETDKRGLLTSKSTMEVLDCLIELRDKNGWLLERVHILENADKKTCRAFGDITRRLKILEDAGISEMEVGDIRLRLHALEKAIDPPKTCGTCGHRLRSGQCWRRHDGKRYLIVDKQTGACKKHEEVECT